MACLQAPDVLLIVDEGDTVCTRVFEREDFVQVSITVADPNEDEGVGQGDVTFSIGHSDREVWADAFRNIADALMDPHRQGFHKCAE